MSILPNEFTSRERNYKEIRILTVRNSPGNVQSPPQDMAKRSSQQLEKTFEEQLHRSLFQVLADLSNTHDAEGFSSSFFTSTEVSIFARRLAIAVLLEQGKSYEGIRSLLRVSTATISSVAEQMKTPGFVLALRKLKVESWAEKWSEKLLRIFGKKIKEE